MLEDLTMIATLPVDEAAVKRATEEGDKDKAAAGETLPAPNTTSVKSASAAPRRQRTKVSKRAGSAAR